MCLTCGWRDTGQMLRVLENPAAVYVWLAVNPRGLMEQEELCMFLPSRTVLAPGQGG